MMNSTEPPTVVQSSTTRLFISDILRPYRGGFESALSSALLSSDKAVSAEYERIHNESYDFDQKEGRDKFYSSVQNCKRVLEDVEVTSDTAYALAEVVAYADVILKVSEKYPRQGAKALQKEMQTYYPSQRDKYLCYLRDGLALKQYGIKADVFNMCFTEVAKRIEALLPELNKSSGQWLEDYEYAERCMATTDPAQIKAGHDIILGIAEKCSATVNMLAKNADPSQLAMYASLLAEAAMLQDFAGNPTKFIENGQLSREAINEYLKTFNRPKVTLEEEYNFSTSEQYDGAVASSGAIKAAVFIQCFVKLAGSIKDAMASLDESDVLWLGNNVHYDGYEDALRKYEDAELRMASTDPAQIKAGHDIILGIAQQCSATVAIRAEHATSQLPIYKSIQTATALLQDFRGNPAKYIENNQLRTQAVDEYLETFGRPQVVTLKESDNLRDGLASDRPSSPPAPKPSIPDVLLPYTTAFYNALSSSALCSDETVRAEHERVRNESYDSSPVKDISKFHDSVQRCKRVLESVEVTSDKVLSLAEAMAFADAILKIIDEYPHKDAEALQKEVQTEYYPSQRGKYLCYLRDGLALKQYGIKADVFNACFREIAERAITAIGHASDVGGCEDHGDEYTKALSDYEYLKQCMATTDPVRIKDVQDRILVSAQECSKKVYMWRDKNTDPSQVAMYASIWAAIALPQDFVKTPAKFIKNNQLSMKVVDKYLEKVQLHLETVSPPSSQVAQAAIASSPSPRLRTGRG